MTEHNDHEIKIAQYQKEIDELKTSNNKYGQIIITLDGELREKKRENAVLQGTLNHTLDELDKLTIRVKETNVANEKFIQNQMIEITTLVKNKIDEYTKIIITKDKEIEELKRNQGCCVLM